MFKHLEDDSEQGDKSIVGTKNLSVSENLDLKKASMEVTHRSSVYDQSSPIKKKVKPDDELDTNEILYVIDKLADAGVKSFTFTGGEATLREDFRTIVQYAVNKFEDVVVHTHAVNDRVLHEYDVTVAIDIDYPNPIDHNGIHRMTDPDQYIYDAEGGPVKIRQKNSDGEIIEQTRKIPRLQAKKMTKSRLTGEKFDTFRKATINVSNSNSQEAVEQFNKKFGTDHSEWKEIKNDNRFSWELFLEKEEPKPLEKYERQQQLALEKVMDMPEDTPLVIRSKITSNNNLYQLIGIADELDAQIVFKPVYPVKESEIGHQMPKPKRFKEAVQLIHKLDYQLKIDIEIDHPIYKLYNAEKHIQDLTAPVDNYKLKEWLKRGRVSEVGVNKIHITPNGSVLPSKHIRHEKYRCGNIREDSIEDVKEKMAEFNKEVSSEEDLNPVGKQFDLRERNIAADPNIYLNNAYKLPEKPENNTLKSKPLQIHNQQR